WRSPGESGTICRRFHLDNAVNRAHIRSPAAHQSKAKPSQRFVALFAASKRLERSGSRDPRVQQRVRMGVASAKSGNLGGLMERVQVGQTGQVGKGVADGTVTVTRTFGPGENITGLEFNRYFTREGSDPFDEVEWELRSAVIANERGELVFE